MAGESDWGSTSKYIGKDKAPKSDWEYGNQPLLDHLSKLHKAAGLPEPVETTPASALQADREAWQALRARRAIRA